MKVENPTVGGFIFGTSVVISVALKVALVAILLSVTRHSVLIDLTHGDDSLSISGLSIVLKTVVPRRGKLCLVGGVEKHPDQNLVITGAKDSVSGTVSVRLFGIKV